VTMEETTVQLDAIRIDGGTQPRTEIYDQLVSEYVEAMGDGAVFPPVVLFFDGVDHWLADGFHRYHAANAVGLTCLPADVREGTKRDAILHSVGANDTHGQRRTNADKRKAVMTLLEDEKWSKWSDRDIARRCCVHHSFVSRSRSSLSLSDSDVSKRHYTDRYGRTEEMNTANIGGSVKGDEQGSGVEFLIERSEAPTPELPAIGPPQNGMQFARMAIMRLEEIRGDDVYRAEAFAKVRGWLDEHDPPRRVPSRA